MPWTVLRNKLANVARRVSPDFATQINPIKLKQIEARIARNINHGLVPERIVEARGEEIVDTFLAHVAERPGGPGVFIWSLTGRRVCQYPRPIMAALRYALVSGRLLAPSRLPSVQ